MSKRELKPLVLTKRQIDNALATVFDVAEARIRLKGAAYAYAWTVWAKRQNPLNQGPRADRQAQRKTVVKP